MKILVVGGGGREHALLWKLRQDAPDAELFVAPGNGGTGALAKSLPLQAGDLNELAGWAEAHGVDLTVAGPEAPLAAGIADAFLRRGLPVFGPTAAATAIESSKSFAKQLMREAKVPTAEFACFTDVAKAEAYIRERGAPVVVKASGLAAGKGAIVCTDEGDALAAARDFLAGAMGDAGREIVVEEMMQGEELSVFGITDGEDVLTMLPSQDHKRLNEGDTGSNTGGMGAYAPVSIASDELIARVRAEIFLPTLAALRDANRAFQGLLYAGIMVTETGPRVVEFNARFGDPETQAILPLLASSLLEPMLAVARGEKIGNATLSWRDAAAVTTVVAAAGYPGDVAKGAAIELPPERDDTLVFHAGSALREGALVTNGGRVLAVTGVGASLEEAARRSREGAEAVHFEGKHYRRDIGWRELARRA